MKKRFEKVLLIKFGILLLLRIYSYMESFRRVNVYATSFIYMYIYIKIKDKINI